MKKIKAIHSMPRKKNILGSYEKIADEKYSKLQVIQYTSIQNPHPTSKNFKENLKFV
jgi:hypothetical protein